MSILTRSPQGAARVDSILMVCATASVVGALVTLLLASTAREPAEYESGDRFPRIDGLDFSRSAATLVMFVNSNCGACQRSAEALRRLARRPRGFQVAVMGPESDDLLRQFVETAAIEADAVLSVPPGRIRFAAVPKLAVVDQAGHVKQVWGGLREIAESDQDILGLVRMARE